MLGVIVMMPKYGEKVARNISRARARVRNRNPPPGNPHPQGRNQQEGRAGPGTAEQGRRSSGPEPSHRAGTLAEETKNGCYHSGQQPSFKAKEGFWQGQTESFACTGPSASASEVSVSVGGNITSSPNGPNPEAQNTFMKNILKRLEIVKIISFSFSLKLS